MPPAGSGGRPWAAPVLVALLGAALRLWDFGRVGANPYYDAAVRSMGRSWHAFFYGAYDPTGQVSIDKTPVDLWLQVASTKLLGFTPVALRLPEVTAGILAIPLLYDLVRRLFGRRAGLVSASVLAVLPVSVMTARSDTMDSVMTLLILAAAWLVVRAGPRGRLLPLAGAGAAMGLAFEVKLFESLVALPGLAVLALLLSEAPWRRRLLHLLAAGGAMVAVGLSWLTAVSVMPGPRPFPIGSTNGSVWDVTFGYNGLARLRVGPTPALRRLDPAGPARLFAPGGALEGRLVGSVLLAALLLGAAAATAGVVQRRRTGAGRPERDAARYGAGVCFLAVWLLTGFVLFSHVGRLHPRYLEAFTPAIAGTIGVAVAALTSARRAGGAARASLIAALAVTAGLGPFVAGAGAGVAAGAVLLVLVTAGLPLAFAARGGRTRGPVPGAAVAAFATAAVLLVPLAGSMQLVRTGAADSGRPGYIAPARVAALSRFLLARQHGARYETASTAPAEAGPLIVHDGRPVLMLTSLYDRPLLTPAALAAQVMSGHVRYVLIDPSACAATSTRCAPVIRWERRHAVDVSGAAGQPPGTLYRLSARASS
ncbi:glycosyltransferase family 39 protein [Paraconexibacter antarcticus]|uniref:Glycosyltransferase family 39 protein n=1 Tax=Paraconexibacter antarcticus TaxID=2949664 RepID=A0ABY5DZ22_9ACTN|nr:glycosyltransferase family 39 protein [Paraconexibacter antarcticus]UTI66122.1 glycosyltransferase family 39 protein [Paraconexibacter antarcticus]